MENRETIWNPRGVGMPRVRTERTTEKVGDVCERAGKGGREAQIRARIMLLSLFALTPFVGRFTVMIEPDRPRQRMYAATVATLQKEESLVTYHVRRCVRTSVALIGGSTNAGKSNPDMDFSNALSHHWKGACSHHKGSMNTPRRRLYCSADFLVCNV